MARDASGRVLKPRRSKPELLDILRACAAQRGRPPRVSDFLQATVGAPQYRTFERHFGSFEAAVQEAGPSLSGRSPQQHYLSDIDAQLSVGICASCGPVRLVRHGGRWRCRRSARESWRRSKRPHRSLVGNRCERCGFVPEHQCQLDVHHLDGDHDNNSSSNVQTLCANCHRLLGVRE
jgi:Homing endonuclease associated repeat